MTDSLWQRSRRPTRGPKPGHSLEDIADAGVRCADREGLVGASMRTVAAELGTTAGALYRYVASRDELIDLMTDRVLAHCSFVPTDGPEAVLQAARELLHQYRSHPWLAQIQQQRTVPGPHTLLFFEHCLRALQPAPTAQIMEAAAMVLGTVTMFSRPVAAVDWAGLDERHPRLTAALSGGSASPPAPDLFDRVVRGLLAGLPVSGSAG